ncbi:MAG TPA: DUF1552 domain-containing protein [Vicinamibacterales bacterium]|jgi:hypothetical protein|nr:DUF1552 domain-containing protein [Vicinamibacterales bacterium]
MYITKRHISRRAVLKGMGVTVALPFLDAMVPAGTAWAKTEAAASSSRLRFVAMEMVHGSAGSTAIGVKKNLFAPVQVGRDFELSPTLEPLAPFKDAVTIVSNTDVRNAEAFTLPEIGGDHFRSSAVFLTQSHPKQTEGNDVHAGISIDQLYASKFGQDTPIPSMQLSIENVDQAGGCTYGYSCIYTDTISWSSPDTPMPMVRDPRVVFDQLFGVGATPEERIANRRADRSILDWMTTRIGQMRRDLGASDQNRLDRYLDNIREIERRIQRVEARNSSGDPRELPEAPIGVPDSFEEHVHILMDLIAIAFASDTTRVFSFKLGRDASGRAYPESGVTTGFHNASHHGEREDRIMDFAKINRYHVSMVPYLLDKLKKTEDGEHNLLYNSVILYGSPMADSNIHNHRRAPLFLAGHAGGALKGGIHIKAPDGTPMANPMLTLVHALGRTDVEKFGDSTSALDLNNVSAASTTDAAKG